MICKVCSTEFTPRTNGGRPQLYCSSKCKNIAKKPNDDKCKRAYAEKHKDDISAHRKERYLNPEVNKEKKKYGAKHYASSGKYRESVRACDLRRRFGITIEEYEAKREAQRLAGDLCGLCRKPLSNVDSTPNLDHDHDTLQLRDFLHRSCNMALGLLKDDPKVCRLAAEYLERHGKQCQTQFQR